MYTDEVLNETDKNLHNKIVSALTAGRDIECNRSADKLDEEFFVEATLAATDIKVTVNGVGDLSFPLSKASVQKLIHFSKTSELCVNVKTVLGKNVRNAQIIDSMSLDVTINQEALLRLTNNMQKALDFPTNSTLTPHLYNMLIYGPGQFFNKHRDSEGLQNMVATLVIVLPSSHIGGDLVIEHDQKKHIFSSQNIDKENVKCICFYSDCWHKVNKIESGYRVVLTFNVVRETNELPDAGPCTNEQLKAAVQEYFNTETLNENPKKLIFFLNHTYTERNLLWNLLKGEDCHYASSFRSVAKELNLDIYLVVANIDQCWTSANENEAVPDLLVETHNTLTCWVDSKNVKLPYDEYTITKSSEFCFTLDTNYKNFVPSGEALFTGPKNTWDERSFVDYWYKRAAVVLWRKSDSLMIYFELNYDGALTEMRSLISVPGNEMKVKEILGKAVMLTPINRPTANDFQTFVDVALYIKAKKEAQTILSLFQLNVLIPENVQFLAQLQQQYGIDWMIELFDALLRTRECNRYYFDTMLSETIYPFVCEFLKSECDRSLIEYLLAAEVATFTEKSAIYNIYHYIYKAEGLVRPRELFRACAAIGDVTLQVSLVQYMTSQPTLFRKKELVRLYLELQKNLPLESSELLRTYLKEAVTQDLYSQGRDVDDWSILEDLPCNCEHCNILSDFLRSKTVTHASWPTDETVHKHIVEVLGFVNLLSYVQVHFRREKVPFRLIVLKNMKLYDDSQKSWAELVALDRCLEPTPASRKRESSMQYDDEKRRKL